ncbi:hypothetical protein LUZ60_016849 [Juncus effusus]|nr:hypothetical protein LUZ60_016849 [Juncus effusus]
MALNFQFLQFTTLSKLSNPQQWHGTNSRRRNCRLSDRRFSSHSITAALMTDPNYFEVGKFIGSYGFMNITSYSSFQSGGISNSQIEQEMDFSNVLEQIGQSRSQNVGEGQVKIRLYEGRVIQGPIYGASVLFKVYPGQIAGGKEADMMAANELYAHNYLQNEPKNICENIQFLLGAFETKTGEQWLAFRNDGNYNAADYAKYTNQNTINSRDLWAKFPILGQGQNWKNKCRFVIKVFYGAINGLAFMHEREMLHQSLGPSSVLLNTIEERNARILVPKLRDLAFSVDIRLTEIGKGGFLSEGLWRRASSAGALTLFEKRAFGISDDIYEAGLLFAYLAFVPFCKNGAMDGVSLRRLLENTFQLDISGLREYCLADDNLLEAVKFLDLHNNAGWELLQAMLNPDYRQRPIAKAVLNHRFMTETV